VSWQRWRKVCLLVVTNLQECNVCEREWQQFEFTVESKPYGPYMG
jgi:hypothetical protein